MPRDVGGPPSASDVAAIVERVESFHQVRVDVVMALEPGGTGFLQVTVTASERLPAGPGAVAKPGQRPRIWAVQETAVYVPATALFSFLCGRLYELDSLLSKERWVQLEVPA